MEELYDFKCTCGWLHKQVCSGFICHACRNIFKPLKNEKEPVAKLHCSDGLGPLRPEGEPHPAMKLIYAYVDGIEDNEPERADDICSIALQLEKKLWELDKGA